MVKPIPTRSKHTLATSDVEGQTVLKPVNDLFPDSVDYHEYKLLKTSSQYDNDVAHAWSRMTKKVTVQ